MIHTLTLIALLAFCNFAQPAQQAVDTADVVVIVKGIKSSEGYIQVALFADEGSFPDEKPFKAFTHTLKSTDDVEVIFKDIPFGDYAIAVYHDKNKNDELDTNLVGIPKEPYGFSNHHKPKFSGPEFKSAKVEIQQLQQTLEVNID